ncbi:MAG: type II toxin-antitoxin system VapC family toxin [Alphaproteobacteria bacterium]|nr:type II toxin-antitoxin system VapC family toxin [Alphaproteobacteria bacterium]
MILDTNALSAWAEGKPGIEAPLRSADRLVVPSVVLGEYYFGIRQSRLRRRYEAWLARYLPLTEVATITSATASAYADICLELKRLGTPIPPNDVWVAALARQHDLAVLSNDSHFDVVAHLERIAFR